ncbi:MAG TPA: hypothetical protein VGI40_00930 [Pirellulaceae bacterium]
MRRSSSGLLLCSLISLCAAVGCTASSRFNWDTLKGPGFPGWTEPLSARTGADSPAAKSSGFFTDRRSEQIEKDLGGF